LNSQIDTITEQTARLNDQDQDYKGQVKKSLYDTEKRGKETQKAKLSLE